MGLFLEHGYDNTPVSLIAKTVGLTKPGLYHYFQSKEKLLFLIHEYYLKKDFIPIIEEAERISDPEERISFFLKGYTSIWNFPNIFLCGMCWEKKGGL